MKRRANIPGHLFAYYTNISQDIGWVAEIQLNGISGIPYPQEEEELPDLRSETRETRRLGVQCIECGDTLPPDARFCITCGTAVCP